MASEEEWTTYFRRCRDELEFGPDARWFAQSGCCVLVDRTEEGLRAQMAKRPRYWEGAVVIDLGPLEGGQV